MAEKKTAPAAVIPAPSANEKVDLFVPRGASNDDPNCYISVNGKNYILPRGKTSRVPKFIADEYNRSMAAQEELDRRKDAMLEATRKAARGLN